MTSLSDILSLVRNLIARHTPDDQAEPIALYDVAEETNRLLAGQQIHLHANLTWANPQSY